MVLIFSYVILAWQVWIDRLELEVESQALQETRLATVFNAPSDQSSAIVIYSLDGEKWRNGLIPATNASLMAWVQGAERPILVAVDSNGRRSVDLRPEMVEPADWRPDVSGRSPAFDVFLIVELREQLENRFGEAEERHLFGHSLGGLYALDMLSRNRNSGFDRVHTYSPTYSHDLSLLDRMPNVCASDSAIYANIGLESGRDTQVFKDARIALQTTGACVGRFETREYPLMPHQIIMLFGQIDSLGLMFSADDG